MLSTALAVEWLTINRLSEKKTEVYLSKETEVDLSKEKEVNNFSMNLVPSSQFEHDDTNPDR